MSLVARLAKHLGSKHSQKTHGAGGGGSSGPAPTAQGGRARRGLASVRERIAVTKPGARVSFIDAKGGKFEGKVVGRVSSGKVLVKPKGSSTQVAVEPSRLRTVKPKAVDGGQERTMHSRMGGSGLVGAKRPNTGKVDMTPGGYPYASGGSTASRRLQLKQIASNIRAHLD